MDALRIALAALLVLTGFAGCTATEEPPLPVVACDIEDPVATWNTTKGSFSIALFGDTPITTCNFVKLAQSGFYNGTRFHRVIDGFMIQDGDPNSKNVNAKSTWGRGGPPCSLSPENPCSNGQYSIQDEFPCADGFMEHNASGVQGAGSVCASHGGLVHKLDKEGYLAMANSGPNTGGSQYFVTLAATSWLDAHHSNFGYVKSGMDVVRAIGAVATNASDQPNVDVIVNSITISPG